MEKPVIQNAVNAPDRPVRVLILEDLPSDASLAKREVSKVIDPVVFRCVETEPDFVRELDAFRPDVIISDYNMPTFDGLSALKIALKKSPVTPFIIHTGSQNEDTAVACMKAGATDYVLKDRMKRLGPAVRQALQTKAVREQGISDRVALEESEQRFRRLAENADDLIFRYEYLPERRFAYVSPSVIRVTGYTPEEHYADPDLAARIFHPDDEPVLASLSRSTSERSRTIIVRWIKKDGKVIWVEQKIVYVMNDQGDLVAIEGIVRDITERKEAEERIEEALQRATESDRLKSAFLNNLSHEIRTPLNSILGFSEFLMTSGADKEEQAEYLRIINNSGFRLLRIINGIIAMSTIETGQEKVQPGTCDLEQLMAKVYKDFARLDERPDVTLSYACDVPAEERIVVIDEGKVAQVLDNLIDNALKYTDKGKVFFSCERRDDLLHFFVSDTGIGIDSQHQELIFKPFRQVSPQDGKVVEGNGLGLAVASSYVEIMGGTIGVESEKGKGSVFHFSIPLHPVRE